MSALLQKEDAISHRAAEFVERQHSGEWCDTDQAELEAWFAESPLHRVAWLRVEWGVARARQLAALRAPTPAVAPVPVAAPTPAPTPAPVRARKFPLRFTLPILAAASIALVAVVGVPFMTSFMQEPDRTYATEVGGRTLLKFADGTLIDLNTDSVVRFRMTGEERKVWLEKGEVWFHVSHNAANPFTVFVGRHRVTDLGTEFLIRRNAAGMEVALIAGRAALSADGAPVAMLTPGQDAVATPYSLSVVRKTPQELADELAWRRGMLVFRDTRLADAVREFNRYNTTKFVIADPSIADLKVSAEIRNDNFAGFLNVAQTMLKLHADMRGNDILLSRATRKRLRRARAP